MSIFKENYYFMRHISLGLSGLVPGTYVPKIERNGPIFKSTEQPLSAMEIVQDLKLWEKIRLVVL